MEDTRAKSQEKEGIITQKSYNFSILGTENFLKGAQKHLKTQGVHTVVKKYKPNVYELRVTNLKEVKNFFEKVYQDSEIHLERKYQKFKECC